MKKNAKYYRDEKMLKNAQKKLKGTGKTLSGPAEYNNPSRTLKKTFLQKLFS